MKKAILFAIASMSVQLTFGQIPPGYYNSATGLTETALKDALNDIISDHTELSYSAVKQALKSTDEDPNNSNNVILLYKGTSQSKSSFGGGANDWNREHVWAKSHGGFGNVAPAGTDLHHLRPTDASVNSSRGNKDFDAGGSPHSEATDCNSDSDSWEPRDEVKGDVARMLMYMAVRYEGELGEVDLELNDQVNNGSVPFHGKLSTLLNWHQNDPVSSFEENRNNVIYSSYQSNRNPFIDHPEYVDLIWGPASELVINSVTPSSDPVYHQSPIDFEVDLSITNLNVTNVTVEWGMNGITFPNQLETSLGSGSIYTTDNTSQFNAGDVIYYRSVVETDILQPEISAYEQFSVLAPVGVAELNWDTWNVENNIYTFNLSNFEGIRVVNAIGQEILSQKSAQLDMNLLGKGVYFIKIQTSFEFYVLKISL